MEAGMETYRANSPLRAANPKAPQGLNFYRRLPDEWLTPPAAAGASAPENQDFFG
jgi:hypothetical protein